MKKQKLRTYMTNKFLLVLGTLLKLVEVVFELFIPIFMGQLVDKGISAGNYIFSYQMLGLIILFALLGYLSTVMSHYIISIVSQNYNSNLRIAVFNKISDFSLENVSTFSPSSLLNRLNNDTKSSSDALALSMRIASRAPFLMIGSVISLFITAPSAAVALIITIPILVVSVILIMKALRKTHRRQQIEADKATRYIKEQIEGIRTIKSYNKEDYELEKVIRQNTISAILQRKLGWVSSLGSPFISLILNSTLVAMIFLISKSFNSSGLQSGDVLAVINYTTQLIMATIFFLDLILMYSQAINSNERLRAVLNLETPKNGNILLEDNKIDVEFKNVCFAFEGQTNLLENINFKVVSGESIGIVGLTGSGKSSILKMLGRFLKINKGEILLNNISIEEYDLKSLRNNISYIFQENYLIEASVEENVTMGVKAEKKEVLAALDLAGFTLNEEELAKQVVKGGSNFSGGQKQRINIARAFFKKSPLLVIDDSLSSLDNITQARVLANLKKLDYKPSVFLVSQQLSLLEHCDKIIVLNNGEIVSMGNHNFLLLNSDLYRQMYNSQNAERVAN